MARLLKEALSKSSLVAGLLVLIVSTRYWWLDGHYMAIALLLIFLFMLPRFLQFEKKALDSREMVLVALLAALAAVARIPFASLPNVQPTSGIICLIAYIFGPEMGFMVGAITALVSNIVLGQGPWTPWQMFAWGMMGWTVGKLCSNNWIKGKLGLSVVSFMWGFFFGWIMDLWFVLGFVNPITLKTVGGAYLASFYFDLFHALSNYLVVYLFFTPWCKKLGRIKRKYGLGADY